jgi:hypothetical protein
MNTKQALLKIQYDRNWEVWAKSPEADAEARYVQPASERTYILEEQGWMRIADGVEIGDFVEKYCEEIPDEDRDEFAEEAVEQFLEELLD